MRIELSFNVTSRRSSALIVTACLFFCVLATQAHAGIYGEFQTIESPGLEIENIAVSVPNNTGENHTFWLSVLALNNGQGFFPLLALAVEPLPNDENHWMAVWNLGDEDPGRFQQLRALIPWSWGPASGKPTAGSVEASRLPPPYLTVGDRTQRARKKLMWNSTRRSIQFIDFLFPAKLLLSSYVHFQDDLEERRFHQVYHLVRLYEETSKLNPSPLDLSDKALLDLKYTLLINRRAMGLAMGDAPQHEVVEAYESRIREHTGMVASYLQSRANLQYLGVQEISYQLPGRTPLGRTALLYIRGSDLPEQMPRWPANNPFDLAYNPYENPVILEMMERDPDVAIPLAFYIFASDLRLKPLLVADFFDPQNAKKGNSIGAVRVAAAHFWDAKSLPFLYRGLLGAANHGLRKKDVTGFSLRPATMGVESTHVYARAGWHADPEINSLLLRSLEDRVFNPLVRSFDVQQAIAGSRYRQLLADDAGALGLVLRKIYEDQVRSELKLGKRAVFAEELEKYERHRRQQAALKLIRRFNDELNQTGYPWAQLVDAWEKIAAVDGNEAGLERKRFIARLESLYPDAIPDPYHDQVAMMLLGEKAITPAAGGH